LYVISDKLKLWSRDEVGLKSQLDSIWTQQNKLMNEYAQIVGDLNVKVLSEKEALVGELVQQGMTKEEAEIKVNSVMDKNQAIENSKQELQKKQEELEAAKNELRNKFAPKDTDDPGIVWGKALRFLTVAMYDDAVNAMQFI
jgi:tetrahydromethanopterin S-methyltransferase subunit G